MAVESIQTQITVKCPRCADDISVPLNIIPKSVGYEFKDNGSIGVVITVMSEFWTGHGSTILEATHTCEDMKAAPLQQFVTISGVYDRCPDCGGELDRLSEGPGIPIVVSCTECNWAVPEVRNG